MLDPHIINSLKDSLASLDILRDPFLHAVMEHSVEPVVSKMRGAFHLDERDQKRHLELALKNAKERGRSMFQTSWEREQYNAVLQILLEPGTNGDSFRFEALRLLSLSETPDLDALNDLYNHTLRFRTLAQPTPPTEVDAAPYLSKFFDALMTEFYIDPFFKQQLSDTLKLRYAQSMQRSLAEILTTLQQVHEVLAYNYTVEQFEHDIHTYTTHIARIYQSLKLVGVTLKDRSSSNTDPDLNGIFVPLHVTLQGGRLSKEKFDDSIITMLEEHPTIVLLGGPGSGKSTVIRHLTCSHAISYRPHEARSDLTILSGTPVPLRIELRRLTEDRRHHPYYNFLSYTTEVLLEREGVKINFQMFEELLERKCMILLFDGLDEVATLDERSRLVEEIEHFAQRYPGNRLIVTSRPIGYELAPFSGEQFSHVQVKEFNNEQVREFLERWYTYVLRLDPLPHNDRQELETLYKTLVQNERLHELATNPLLLTVITTLNRHKRLPDKRVQVYEECANLLLETWAERRGKSEHWHLYMTERDQRACVAYLGSVLHERSQENRGLTSDVSLEFLQHQIEQFLKNQNSSLLLPKNGSRQNVSLNSYIQKQVLSLNGQQMSKEKRCLALYIAPFRNISRLCKYLYLLKIKKTRALKRLLASSLKTICMTLIGARLSPCS